MPIFPPRRGRIVRCLLLTLLLIAAAASTAATRPATAFVRLQSAFSPRLSTTTSPFSSISSLSTPLRTPVHRRMAPTSSSTSSSSLLKTTSLKAFELVGKSTRWTVASMVAVVLLVRRDAAMVNFTVGAILNAVLGKVLKRLIKEARPDGAVLEDPGMPSSHAMALFYMTAFITAALCQGKGLGLPAWWPVDYRAAIALVGVYVAVASSWRVFSGLHTQAQIGVGALVGSGVGVAWQHFCRTALDEKVAGVLVRRYPGAQVPFAYLAGVMVVGALTVGSVERKISAAMRRILADGRKKEESSSNDMKAR